jgi:hypothetical protein
MEQTTSRKIDQRTNAQPHGKHPDDPGQFEPAGGG